MTRKKKEEIQDSGNKSSLIAVWILLGLLAVSILVNLITILSSQGLKKTVLEMREPVQRYFTQRLDDIEAEFDHLVLQTRSDKGQSPHDKDIKQLSRHIDDTRALWERTLKVSGTRWITLYWKAQRKQAETEEAWKQLKPKLTY
jgi:hypothetical protein